jgi:hypothetical protein
LRKETSMLNVPGEQELSRQERLDLLVRAMKIVGSSTFDPDAFALKLAEDGRLSPDDVHRAVLGLEALVRLYDEEDLEAQGGAPIDKGATP